MNHKITLHGVILMSGILSFAVFIHETNGIITDSNKLDCTDIQCPIDCPKDSYLQAAENNFEEDEDDDYVEDLMTPEPYIEEIGHFEELPPEVEMHETNSQHSIKERQRREVFFQDEIDRCCGDQICVCHKSCPNVPKCSSQEVAVEIKEGLGRPGNCCSTYKCEKKVTCGAGVKQSWWNNKCIKCSCFGDNEICEQLCAEEEVIQNCYSEYWQKPMMNGVSWKEGGCTSCTCEMGERSCLTPVCPKLECKKTITLEDECCAKCVDEEEENEVVKDLPNFPLSETTTGKENLVASLSEESSTQVSQMETTTNVNNSTTLLSKNDPTSTTQLPLIAVTNTTTTPDFSSSISSIVSSTEAKNSTTLNEYSSTTESEIILENTTTEATPIVETTTSVEKENEILTSIEVTEDSVKSSTDASTSETATTSPVAETTTSSSIESSTDTSSTTTSTLETTEESSLKVIDDDESSTIEVISSEVFSSTMPTLINTNDTEELTTKANLVKSTTEKEELKSTTKTVVPAEISKETDTAESSTFLPAQELVTSTSTTNTITESTTSAKLLEPITHLPLATTSTSSHTTPTVAIDSTTPETISSTNLPKTINISATNKAIDSTTTTTTTTTTISTTSSPYTSTTTTTTAPSEEGSTSSSTTSAPEPVEPFFQSFGDRATVATQQQMRGMFDKIDYVVMIVLFIGALLCIALGLIIRHTKNRKKMYSSIPNSETSLSQTSTNTMMTV